MKMNLTMSTSLWSKVLSGLVSVSAVLVIGCGGAGTVSEGTPIKVQLDSFTAELMGAAQAPVTIHSASGAVTGIAGASFTNVVATDRFSVPIVYASDEDGDDEIWLMLPDASRRTKITSNNFTDTSPAISPDGTRIVFSSDRNGNNDIFSMNLDGSNVVQHTNSNSGDREPCWSPDGTRIAFTSARDGSYEVYTMLSTGLENGVVQITNGGADTSANSQVSWSPDGTKLAYHCNRVAIGNYECFIKNADGTGSETNITNNSATDQYPQWSPDGSRLVIASTRAPSTGYDIWTINSSTGGSGLQLTSATGTDWEPVYSRDGTKVYFSSSRDDVSAPISYELYSVSSSGGSEARLTFDTDTSQEASSTGEVWQNRYIGTFGRIDSAAAGFLFGQSGSTTTSFLSFDTVGGTLAGRGAARIVANSAGDTSLSNFFFTISTTVGISKIRYVNSFGAVTLYPNVINIQIPALTTNALVTYSGTGASAGQVVSILPYAANRSRFSTKQLGDTVVVSGSFPAVYNSKGENLAPNGASVVRYDAQTGEIKSFE